MRPSFPLKYNELILELKEKGSYSFDFKQVNKGNLRKAFERLNKAAILMHKANSLFGKLRFIFYSIYADIIHRFVFRNDEGGKWALIYYSTAIHHISKYDGEDLDENMARVTFIART